MNNAFDDIIAYLNKRGTMQKIVLLCCCLFFCTQVNAQSAVNAMGGSATSAGGSVSISIGIPDFENATTAGGYIALGVQHTYLLATTIYGSNTVCVGDTTTLIDSSAGGVWSSRNTAIATIGSTTGVVTGVATGTDTISYTLYGSVATKVITVNALPVAGTIAGAGSLCTGTVGSTYTDTASGGTWSLTNTHAVISSGSVVVAVSAGIDTLKYTVTNACGSAIATKIITINALPAVSAITGIDSVCVGNYDTLSNATSGGIWSSMYSYATIGSTGIVTGVSVGLDTISYAVTNTCGTTYSLFPLNVLSALACGTLNIYNKGIYNDIFVFPNPNNGVFTIYLPPSSNVYSVSIIDLYGKEIYSNEINNNNLALLQNVNISHVAGGSYLVKIRNGSTVFRQKVVVF